MTIEEVLRVPSAASDRRQSQDILPGVLIRSSKLGKKQENEAVVISFVIL